MWHLLTPARFARYLLPRASLSPATCLLAISMHFCLSCSFLARHRTSPHRRVRPRRRHGGTATRAVAAANAAATLKTTTRLSCEPPHFILRSTKRTLHAHMNACWHAAGGRQLRRRHGARLRCAHALVQFLFYHRRFHTFGLPVLPGWLRAAHHVYRTFHYTVYHCLFFPTFLASYVWLVLDRWTLRLQFTSAVTRSPTFSFAHFTLKLLLLCMCGYYY